MLHSKGEWLADSIADNGPIKFIVAPDPSGIHPDIYLAELCDEDDADAEEVGIRYVADDETRNANGLLMAAAPNLLEACREALAWFTDFGQDTEAADLCRAAIDKATVPTRNFLD